MPRKKAATGGKQASAKPTSVKVDANKHVGDKRSNIPTRETAGFQQENAGQPFVVHRDRSLDPQLVWKGKDEQDAKPLEVPAVPIHVQEKIHPQAIVEEIRRAGSRQRPVADLFSDFNGLDDFAKKLEFYQHDQHWTNRLILPFYLLADSPAGRKKQAELSGVASAPRGSTRGANATPLAVDATPLAEPAPDLHRGFVYRTVPHVTLKSIANNPDIKEGMTRDQIDQAIAKHADTETLYLQPYEDKDVVRVSGPFTVESLSPHRSLPAAEATPVAHAPGSPGPAASFGQMILDNLRKAGVKGTDKKQRITLARLDSYPGEYIHAEGEADAGAAVRVCIGPEFGTLGDADIKKAAFEAIKGSRCDLLLVCAFAFEASIHEQTAELTKEIKLGKLAILPVRMNPDLAMGDELLKKTGAGNLFTVFGEPDIKLTKVQASRVASAPGEQWTVTIQGVDVFDPSTGAVRTGDTDDIACWFIDTDYDGQSFFVRHAYFLYGGKDGADGPYDKLKKALRAEIDEGEWSKLYSASSQPFDPPKSGKIAVKVINHFGDEVLKVYAVPRNGKKR